MMMMMIHACGSVLKQAEVFYLHIPFFCPVRVFYAFSFCVCATAFMALKSLLHFMGEGWGRGGRGVDRRKGFMLLHAVQEPVSWRPTTVT